ncbi:MAG TPA: hypothetical protein VFV50_18595 [Bdellovibrionales bacterium]|nr:hypothetical protein [Bdellovibrionales bacterium]
MANPLGPIDIEINAQKAALQRIQVQIRATIAGFAAMPPKERARNISEIQKSLENISRFFDKLKGSTIQNTGTRFAVENLKQSFFTVRTQWRKFELTLNVTRVG